MLIENLFDGERLTWNFTDLDRLAVGGVAPGSAPVPMANVRQTGADFFLARREMGVINIGAPGVVRADGKSFELGNLDTLYLAAGTKSVEFASTRKTGGGGSSSERAKFYLVSCPAHGSFPTTLLKKSDCKPVSLGSQATANQRQIFQMIHQGGIRSSQLVMGFTELAEGSVWNTMPPHTHTRRTEIYCYFDVPGENVVAHFLGPPDSTRHVFVHNEQVVLSPSWSIHAGCGTSHYKFIWAMAGENQTFDDMDEVKLGQLR